MPTDTTVEFTVLDDEMSTGLETAAQLEDDPPALRVSWIRWDSKFRGSGLRVHDRIVAVNGRPVTSSPFPGQKVSLPNSVGHYNEAQAWKDEGAREGAPVTLTVRRRARGGEGVTELSVSGALVCPRIYFKDRYRYLGAGGPPEMFENDGFDSAWSSWYERALRDFQRFIGDDCWMNESFSSQSELRRMEEEHTERMRVLAEKYPGPFTDAARADWEAVCEGLRGRAYELAPDALDYRKAGERRAEEVSAAGRAAREAFMAAHADEIIPAFPVIDPILGDRAAVAGKLVELPTVTERNWVNQGATTCFLFGDGEYVYVADAEGPGVQALLEAERRYEKLVAPWPHRRFDMIARILPTPTLVVSGERGQFGLKVEPVAVSHGDNFFVDVSPERGASPTFAGEEQLTLLHGPEPPEDAPARAVLEAFFAALKSGDQKLWQSLFGGWDLSFTDDRFPIVRLGSYANLDRLWIEARAQILDKVCDVRVVWMSELRAVVTGQEFEGAPRIDQVAIEVDHIGQLEDGSFRAFNSIAIHRVWLLQRYNGGPFRVVAMPGSSTAWGI